MNRLIGLLPATALASSFMIASIAKADLRVSFDEGAPKDRFRIENAGTCSVSESSIMADLSTSEGGLIFDVTAEGEGVEVFHPFELVKWFGAIEGLPTVADGQTEDRSYIVSLAPDEVIEFTIDVDDTRGQRAITVSGAETEGAGVTYSHAQVRESSFFSALFEAEILVPGC